MNENRDMIIVDSVNCGWGIMHCRHCIKLENLSTGTCVGRSTSLVQANCEKKRFVGGKSKSAARERSGRGLGCAALWRARR